MTNNDERQQNTRRPRKYDLMVRRTIRGLG